MNEKEASVSFETSQVTTFTKKGAYVILDFGKELCGGIRLITRAIGREDLDLRITLGESLSEACSNLGE